ncbi:MAG: prefoldin subunit [Candidatus Iainarchaeum sp.]|nr:MAG: Prefoldin subunit beta [archaeon ADurb.Bin336]
MDEQERRATIMEFEKNRQILGNISAQKQQFAFQLEMFKASLEEMDKNKEKNVYKVVGNVLFLKDAKEMKKELEERKESTELRVKTLEKQEETIIKKLNALKVKLEGAQKEEEKKKTKK